MTWSRDLKRNVIDEMHENYFLLVVELHSVVLVVNIRAKYVRLRL
jgi:hypothetical protein